MGAWDGTQLRCVTHRHIGMAQVDQANALYRQLGLGGRDDATAMQYLIPGWTFDPKRPCLVR